MAPGSGRTAWVLLALVGSACVLSAQAPVVPPMVSGWPTSFPSDTGAMDLPTEEVTRAGGLELRVRYPAGWTSQAHLPYIVTIRDGEPSRSFAISSPVAASYKLDESMPPAQIEQSVFMLARQRPDITLVASGYSQQPDGPFWVWYEYDAPIASAALELTPFDRLRSARARVGNFVTTVAGRFFSVNCAVLVPRGAAAADRKERFARAGQECGAMLRRLSVQPS